MLVKRKKNNMDARGSDDGSEFSKFPDCKKNEPPGRNLGITLKINKWALLKETACNKMTPTTYPYHVVLVPKTKHKKGNESGINYPGELKRRIPHGDTNIYSGR
jgi:hypothetical protein